MSTSGVISAFKFESYKIDSLELKCQKNLELLSFRGFIPEEEWRFSISLLNPVFFKEKSVYVGGVQLSLAVLSEEGKAKVEKGDEPSLEDMVISIKSEITGLFSAQEGRFEPSIEETLVKVQIPALLLPYLRAAVGGLLANAGFGSVVFPLINIHDLAITAFKDVEIKIV
jgi:preprotein translocase subunit SecB